MQYSETNETCTAEGILSPHAIILNIFIPRVVECRKYIELHSGTFSRDSVPETATLRKLVFHFLSNWIGYDRGDSFPFDFEPNGILFGYKSKGKLSPRSNPIQFDKNWNTNFVNALV